MAATIEQSALWVNASRLLDCVADALAATVAGAPDWRCVAPGTTVIPEHCHCGQLSVFTPALWPGDPSIFPDRLAGQARCTAKITVVEYAVTVLRCVPQLDDQGRPPPCDQIETAAQVDFDDRYAMRRGVACCPWPGLWTYGDHLAVGEEGMCAGSELHVFVALPNCEAC